MNQEITQIVDSLKAARIQAGITQGELARRTGLTQSHISKIESGETDLRVSNLIEIARNVRLEPVLVPFKDLPLVQRINELSERPASQSQRPAFELTDEEDPNNE